MDRVVCQGVEAVSPSAVASSRVSAVVAATGSSRWPASSTVAAWVPAAPPTCTGSTSAEVASYASSTPVNQPAALKPNVVGTACWVRVRATIGVRRCCSTRSASSRTCSRSALVTTPTASRAQQHQRRVDDVLAGQSPVQPACPVGVDVGQRGAQHVDEGGGRVAAALRLGRDHREVLGTDESLEVELGDAGRGDAGSGQRVQPRLFDGDHRCEEGLVGEEVAGALVTGPQEVAHRVSVARRGRRGTPSPRRPGRRPGAGCRRRSRGRRQRRAASPAGRRPARRAACPGDGPEGTRA